MINYFDTVCIRWTTRNKTYYTNRGYKFTAFGDELYVCIQDLPENSSVSVPVLCDCPNCTTGIIMTPYRNYNKIIAENGIYRCKSCTIKNNHNKSIIESGKRDNLYKLFLNKCKEHGAIPVTKFEDFNGVETMMEYICPIHGETETLMKRIAYNDAWCYQCGKDQMKQKLKLSPQEVQKIVELKNKNKLINADEYINSNTKNLKVICGQCHKLFVTSLASIINSDGRCSDCGYRIAGELRKTTEEQLIELSTLDGEIMVINPDDYIDMDTPLLFKCSECGAEFSATPRNYLKRNFTRCKNCRHYSKGEESIAKYLEEHNIVFIRQMKFDECSDKRPLPFDFYLPYYNMLIEYNGEQHYRPIEYWGGNEKFEYIKYHDDIKLDYAINNNINLLVIKYTEDDNIEQILKNKLNLE